MIYHPPFGTTREDIFNTFEHLRMLAYSGYQENIQFGRYGNDHVCILDASNNEILSVTFNDTGGYTLKCEDDINSHIIAIMPPKTENPPPQTTEDYEAIWSAWEKAAPPEEEHNRSAVVEQIRLCQSDNNTTLLLRAPSHLTSLPDYLPAHILDLIIIKGSLPRLPALPSGLQSLSLHGIRLSKLPELPSGLKSLGLYNILLSGPPELPSGLQCLEIAGMTLSNLPELPSGLQYLNMADMALKNLLELPSGLQSLELDNTALVSLPVLPSGLQRLVIRDATIIKPELMSELDNLMHEEYSIPLTSLPVLPPTLQSLEVANTELTSLPELPPTLQSLEVANTEVTSLPVLPPTLQSLQVTNTELTSLPELPSTLQSLQVEDTLLTSLPVLPLGLHHLSVSDSPLTSLPVLPPTLQTLSVTHTGLTSLPESIASLSPQAEVDLNNNPLTERTLLALRNMTRDRGYSGPHIYFSMRRTRAPQEIRPLHLAVADWLAPTNEGKQAPSGRWQDFGQQDNAPSFSKFLDRLSETQNARTDPGFNTQITALLADLAEDDELRAKTFAMATEASSSCEDRITLALNHMKNVQLVHRAEKGEFDRNPSALVAVGREMFRLDKLEQIAREKASTLHFIDEIEVYLTYQNKLKEPLELTSVTKEMRFFDVANVTESDLKSAETQVNTAENSHFMTWILQWAPLHRMLEHTNPALWQARSEKKIADYNDTYRILSDTELKPAGLLDNDDAVRAIGARAMESAEKAFLEGLSPLVNQMLAGHLDARWS